MVAALLFGAHGYTLLFRPEQAMKQYPWATGVPEPLKRFIGVAELLGAIGPIVDHVSDPLLRAQPVAAFEL